MNPRVVDVRPLDDFKLKLVFTNGEHKIFDARPYLNIGDFCELNDTAIFNSVAPVMGSIQWSNGLDLCPDCLYLESVEDNSPA
jgi:hypothetical protein